MSNWVGNINERIDLIFECVNLLHCRRRKINLKRDQSNIDYSNWIKSQNATINPINDDNKYFQCAAKVALNHGEIKKKKIKN